MADKNYKIKITAEGDDAGAKKVAGGFKNLEAQIEATRAKLEQVKKLKAKYEKGEARITGFDGISTTSDEEIKRLTAELAALETQMGKTGGAALKAGGERGVGGLKGKLADLKRVAINTSPSLAKFLTPMSAGVALASVAVGGLIAAFRQLSARAAEFWDRMAAPVAGLGRDLDDTREGIDAVGAALEGVAEERAKADELSRERLERINDEVEAERKKLGLARELTMARIDQAVAEGKMTEDEGEHRKLQIDRQAGEGELALDEKRRAKMLAERRQAFKAAQEEARKLAEVAAKAEAAAASKQGLVDPKIMARLKAGAAEEIRLNRAGSPDEDDLKISERMSLAYAERWADFWEGKIFDVIPSPNDLLESAGFNRRGTPKQVSSRTAEQEASLKVVEEENARLIEQARASREAEKSRRQASAQQAKAAAAAAAEKARALEQEAAEQERRNNEVNRRERENLSIKQQTAEVQQKTRSITRERAAAAEPPPPPPPATIAIPERLVGVASAYAGARRGTTTSYTHAALVKAAEDAARPGGEERELQEVVSLFRSLAGTQRKASEAQKEAYAELKKIVVEMQNQLANNSHLRE